MCLNIKPDSFKLPKLKWKGIEHRSVEDNFEENNKLCDI
jgi:hypothetical protein